MTTTCCPTLLVVVELTVESGMRWDAICQAIGRSICVCMHFCRYDFAVDLAFSFLLGLRLGYSVAIFWVFERTLTGESILRFTRPSAWCSRFFGRRSTADKMGKLLVSKSTGRATCHPLLPDPRTQTNTAAVDILSLPFHPSRGVLPECRARASHPSTPASRQATPSGAGEHVMRHRFSSFRMGRIGWVRTR